MFVSVDFFYFLLQIRTSSSVVVNCCITMGCLSCLTVAHVTGTEKLCLYFKKCVYQ